MSTSSDPTGQFGVGRDGRLIPVTGSIAQAGQSNEFRPRPGHLNLTVWGNFTATFQVERTFDSGVTWFRCTNGGQVMEFTGPLTEVLNEPEAAVRYRLVVTAMSAGTLNYRWSQ